jgi:hypothetical protein
MTDPEYLNTKATPPTCLLSPLLLMVCALQADDPCAGCNHDREVCHGRPRSPLPMYRADTGAPRMP